MTEREALKLALEALKRATNYDPVIARAITAIKEALAQPEQEPVGWAEHGVINWLADKQFNHTSFLYTTPPQRTWVGLTDEEIWTVLQFRGYSTDTIEVAKAIEAKLKEKNNG